MYESDLHVYWPDGEREPGSPPRLQSGDARLLRLAVERAAIEVELGDAVPICQSLDALNPILRVLDTATVERLITGTERTVQALRNVDDPEVDGARSALPRIVSALRSAVTQGAWVVVFDGEPPQPVWIPADAVNFEADGSSLPGGTEILRHSLELGSLLHRPADGIVVPVEEADEALRAAITRREFETAELALQIQHLRACLAALDRVVDPEGYLLPGPHFRDFQEDGRWDLDGAGFLIRRRTGERMGAWRARAGQLADWLENVIGRDRVRLTRGGETGATVRKP